MNKKIIKLLTIVVLIVLSLLYRKNVYASSTTKVHLIFNKISYDAGEEIKLTINLENFSKLNETKVIIKCNDNAFVPIMKNDRYGQITNNSIYESPIINEYVLGGYLRFQLHKDNLSEGYYSGYKNNVGEFYFETRKKISNIYDYFRNGNFESLTTGINVSLYDIYNQEISTEFKWSEKIKVDWNVDKYQLEVYDEIPLFVNDISITNRNENEYDLFFQDKINNKNLGSQVVTIAIYDKVNADYILLSKVVEVVDTTSPVITGSNNISVESNKLRDFKITEYFVVSDNYDKTPEVVTTYYDVDNKLINNQSLFLEYLLTHLQAKVVIKVLDSSGNASDEFEIIIEVKDVEAPVVNYPKEITIKDVEIADFDFMNYVTVTDDYDSNPRFIITYLCENIEIEDQIDALLRGKKVIVRYYAEDKSSNKTQNYETKIEVLDTTPPIINNVENIEITDQEAINFDFSKLVSISDNIDKNPKINFTYYLESQEVSRDEWKKAIVRGHKGVIKYYGIDASNNKTSMFETEIIVCDITPPVIKIHNIKEGNKYLKIEKLDYEVLDNFDGNIDISVTLNGIEYHNEGINKPGEYVFKVTAVDKAGNESIKEVKFEIIENNVIGCGGDIECYLDNYLAVVVIAGILMAIILTIFIVRLCLWQKKKQVK